MKKLLPLLCFVLLPLSMSAIVENATVTAEVLPSASDEWLALRAAETEKLKTYIEAQLAKMPELSGIYAGFIQIHEPQTGGDGSGEAVIGLLRVARLQEGSNAVQIADEDGTFAVEMTFKPEGLHWLIAGKIDYCGHGSEQRHSMGISAVVPTDLAVFLAGSPATHAQIREIERANVSAAGARDSATAKVEAAVSSAARVPANDAAGDAKNDLLTGYFFLRTADAPDPQASAANPIHRVQLPSGRVIQLEPGLSKEAARAVIATKIARDAEARPAADGGA